MSQLSFNLQLTRQVLHWTESFQRMAE